MATTTTQGNSESPSYPANTCNSVYVYVTASCATVAVGCTLFYDSARTIKMPAGTYKVEYANDNKWQFTVDANGVVTAASRCVWYSNQTYSEMWTGVKNNCSIGSCTSVSGSTVTLNDNGNNVYVTGGTYTSYISQADADSNAFTSAYNEFQAGKQNKVNEYGYCTWTYSSGSGTYSQDYTRNNCGANCYGTTVNYSNTQSGYSAQSTVSCQDAINTANNAAYNQAVAIVQANGQNHANANGSCCCWVYEEYCSGCTRRSRERNNCTGEYRNDSVVSNSSCSCGNTCGGTYYYYYCSGTTRWRTLRYSCDNSNAATTEVFANCSSDCGANTFPSYTFQNYTTCFSCSNSNVYKDTNTCSGSYNNYFVYYNGNYVNVGGPPTGGSCNTSSACGDTGSGYCSGPNYVINRTQYNPCSNESCPSPRVIEYNSTTYGCYTPPSCKLYELYMYGGYSEFVYVTYSVCGGGASTLSAYNDGGGGYGGQVCAVEGTAYISSGSGALIDQGSCNNT